MNELNVFFERYKRFVTSLFFVTACLMAAGYSTLYHPRSVWMDHALELNRKISEENGDYSAKLKKIADAQKIDSKDTNKIRSLPVFLERINSVAKKTGVIIHKLKPSPENDLLFTLQIIEDYFKFIRFSSILESLNVTIKNIEVHPYDISKSPPTHVISFQLIPRADAEELSSARISFLKDQVARTDKRNPFQRYAFNKEAKKAEIQIDLTWDYKLSGIGRIGDDRYATINDQDYKKGDELDGMLITDVSSKRVLLQKESKERGVEKFQLKFRKTKKKNK